MMPSDPVLGPCRPGDVLYVQAADADGHPTCVVPISGVQPWVTLAGAVVRLRIPGVQEFTFITGARRAALDAIEDLAERDKAYEAAGAANWRDLEEPGLELWLVDPSGAKAVVATKGGDDA